MKVITVANLRLPGGEIPSGKVITIPDQFLQRLAGKVQPLDQKAWLEEDELRTRGYISDLSSEIVRLTETDLSLQKILLQRHCEEYDHRHIWRLYELWEERAAIMEHNAGMTKEHAEVEAARSLMLTAFLEEMQYGEGQAA
jgi:hypothetical protein